MLTWATVLAERYVPAGRTGEYGERNAVPGELLCRLHLEHLNGSLDIAE